MHNYPFNTGYSLTDINELSETTHTDTHPPTQAHTHKSNWTAGKNEQPFCHMVNTNCIDLQFYIKSTQTTTIAKWHGLWGCEWYLSVLHSLQAFKTVSSVGPWDKTQNQILQWLLDWNGQEARGDSYNTISKQSSFFKDEFKPIPQNTVWHQASEETKENIPYPFPPKTLLQMFQNCPCSFDSVVIHKLWNHKRVASQIAAVMQQLHLQGLPYYDHESWIFVIWTASFKVTKGLDLLVELSFI